MIITILFWTNTIVLEALSGNHTSQLINSLKFSFLLFIFREVIFFGSIFWTFFDRSLSPNIELGENWSPIGINPVNPYGIPLFNSVVLLRRGISLTWAHSCLLSKKSPILGILLTLLLALIFEIAQYVEFKEATFSIRDGIFGRVFYFGTGFHGLHVIFGHIFLTYNLFRIILSHFSRLHHLSFEFSIVYWHFVDVVWLFLYCFIYWWRY